MRMKEELQRSQEHRRKEQFEALVQNVRRRVVAGGYVASICPFPYVPISRGGNCTATTEEQAERMDME